MNSKRIGLFALFLSLLGAAPALALDLIVEHNPTDGHFGNIQAALTYARNQLSVPNSTASFRIKVMADPTPYSGPFTPISNVPIFGSSTGGTFIIGSGAGPTVTVNGVTGISIRNFTFLGAATGISIVNSGSVTVSNNIFQVGTGGTAIQVQNSPNASIINNTFYQNGTAINDTASDLLITNNIFDGNTTAIATTVPLSQLTYNDYFNNATNGVAKLDANSMLKDPLFVHPVDGDYHLRDFHLSAGSPAHSFAGRPAGNPNYPNSFDPNTFDMGAYGGPNADLIPAAVQGVTATLNPDGSITVSWNADQSGQAASYRLYYGSASGNYNGSNAAQGHSPITVPGSSTSQTLTGLTAGLLVTPPAPTLVGVSPVNNGLTLTWVPSSSPDVTGYQIYYSTDSIDPAALPAHPIFVSGAATSSYTITGLTNGVTYHVAVSAVAQTTYFFAVTAVNSAGVESAKSPETSLGVGAPVEGSISAVKSDFPEAVSAYPNLKSEGCFIATAAYGFYCAPQVQALRDFRDRYLLTNAPGRALVAWYYRYGPIGAHFLNLHPWLKPPVRILLLPLVLLSALLVYGSAAAKLSVAILAASPFLLLLHRRAQLRTGGVR